MSLRSLARGLLEGLNRWRLRALRAHLRIAPSARLMRHFDVAFLVQPEARTYVTVGEQCVLDAAIVFEAASGRVELGDRVYIGNGTRLISRNRITIGNDVTMAWGITIYDHNSHSLDWRRRRAVVAHFHRTYGQPGCYEGIDWTDVKSAPIVICDKVWIGFDVVVLKGVTVGEGAIVAARSVVTRDVPPFTIVAGNPALPVGRVPQEAAP
jgi:acetyltransferase-like isoleucine patch superfamily enzyme